MYPAVPGEARPIAREDLAGDRARIAAQVSWLAAREAQLLALAADRILDALAVTAREEAHVDAEIDGSVRELNAMVDRYNAIVPAEGLRLPPVSAGALRASAS